MQQKLFRKVALERISSPEQLDQLMKVISPRSWQIAIGVGTLLVALAIWGVSGQLTVTVSASGVLVQPGLSYLMAPSTGLVTGLQVGVGDTLAIGQSAVLLALPNTDSPTRVSSPYAGRVAEIKVRQGDFVTAGEPLLAVNQGTLAGTQPADIRLQAVLYVPLDTSSKIKPCMRVQMVPAGVRAEEKGYLLGTVYSIQQGAVTQQTILRRTGNLMLARKLLVSDDLVEVMVTLDYDTAASAYAWTIARGRLTPLTPSMLCVGTIMIDQQAPVNLILARPSQPDARHPSSVSDNSCQVSGTP